MVRWRSRAASSTRPSASSSADALLHLRLDVDERRHELVVRRHEVGGRVDVEVLALRDQLAGQRVDLRDPLDLVAEELHPRDAVLGGGLRPRACRRGRGTAPGPAARRCAGTAGPRGGAAPRRGGSGRPCGA